MPPAARSLRAIWTYATEKMVRTIVAKKNAAGAYFSLPAPDGEREVEHEDGQRRRARDAEEEDEKQADGAGSQLLDALIGTDVDRGDRSLVSQMGVDNSPSLRARHRASGFEFAASARRTGKREARIVPHSGREVNRPDVRA